MDNINLELLITLVEERPVLWDKTLDEYKNKRLTSEAWREICLNINDGFESLTDAEKNDFGKLLSKKWANIKDNWVKCHKKLLKNQSGSGTKRFRNYIYYDQMQFLKKTIDYSSMQSNMDTDENSQVLDEIQESETNTHKSHPPIKREQREDGEIEAKIIKMIDALEKEEKSRAKSFFNGITPTVDSFNDDETVEFQFEVLKIIRNIKHKRRALLHPDPLDQQLLNQESCSTQIKSEDTSLDYHASTSQQSFRLESPLSPTSQCSMSMSGQQLEYDGEYVASPQETKMSMSGQPSEYDGEYATSPRESKIIPDFDFS